MDDRRRLLLALGITEWAATLAHLKATAQPGSATPTETEIVSGELGYLMRQWSGPMHDAPDEVVAQARAYCTENVEMVDEVLERMRHE